MAQKINEIGLISANQLDLVDIGVFGLALIVSFMLSTLFIRRIMPALELEASASQAKLLLNQVSRINTGAGGAPAAPASPKTATQVRGPWPDSRSNAVFDYRAVGFWIGLFETFLIFVLVAAQAYSALAIIIGAKEIVRQEGVRARPEYYLLGTLANLAIAILCVLAAIWLVAARHGASDDTAPLAAPALCEIFPEPQSSGAAAQS